MPQKRFFKSQAVWDNIQSYFKAKNIQTSDSLTSDFEVQTKDSFWFYSQMGYAYSWYEKNIARLNLDRRRRYEEYNLMDADAEVSAALSIWADEATCMDVATHEVLKIKTDNEKVKTEVERLFFETLQIEEQLWGLTRDLCKFGDAPFEIVLDEKKQNIVKLVPIPIDGFFRIEEDSVLKRFEFRLIDSLTEAGQTFQVADGSSDATRPITYEPFQVAHWSIKTNDPRYRPYGFSILEAARKVWKQLKILEESLIINRLTRAPERRIFYVDIGNLSPAESSEYLNKIKQEYTKKKFFNPLTGEIDEQASPLNQQEDFWIPRRGNVNSTEVQQLPGMQNIGEIEDINLFRDKILAALKVPPAYLGRGANIREGGGVAPELTKAGLSNLDKKFARAIQRVQKAVVSQLYKIAYVQLYLRGFSEQEIRTLEIGITAPSNLDEQLELELMNQRLTAASTMSSIMGIDNTYHLFPDKWIYKHIFKLTDQEIEKVIEMRKEEIPAAGTPGQEGMGGSPGAGGGAVGGIEGEFDQFAAGKEGEPAAGEKPAEGEPEATAEVPAAGVKTPEKPIAEIRKVLSERKFNTKYHNRNYRFKNLLIENELDGLEKIEDDIEENNKDQKMIL